MKSVKKSSKAKIPRKRVPQAKTNIGLFGGTFDPLHFGHIGSMRTVADQFKLKTVKIIPAFHSPGRPLIEGPSPVDRLEMVKCGLSELDDRFVIEDCEIKRKSTSYTIDTIKELESVHRSHNVFLIIGMDQFENFHHWKDYTEILKKVNLIVTSRPGSELPKNRDELPRSLAPFIKSFGKGKALLKSNKSISFVQLKDIDVSATEIRRRFRNGESVKDLLPEAVEKFIKARGLYESVGSKISDYGDFTHFCASVLNDKSGIHVLGFDLRKLQHPSEYTVIASGTSTRHAMALSEHVIKSVKERYGIWPQSLEGQKEGRWIVIDYGVVIVHVFYDFVRSEYRLEELWKEAEEMRLNIEGPNPDELRTKSVLN